MFPNLNTFLTFLFKECCIAVEGDITSGILQVDLKINSFNLIRSFTLHPSVKPFEWRKNNKQTKTLFYDQFGDL